MTSSGYTKLVLERTEINFGCTEDIMLCVFTKHKDFKVN